jgi:hypothetical protein
MRRMATGKASEGAPPQGYTPEKAVRP